MKTFSKVFITGMFFCAAILSACNGDETIDSRSISVTKLTASPVLVTVPVGGLRAIQAEVTPLGANQMIYWKSDNPEIAEVGNGIIIGISPGVTTVTVISVEDANKKAEISVTVVPTAIPVEEISFGVASPLTVYLDEPFQLPLKILPLDATNRELLWKNSNPAVATVSETGLITPLMRGTTTLTILAASNVNITATLNVTVTLRYIALESIKLSAPDIKIRPGETYRATVTYVPADATNKNVSWSSSDEAIATVVNGVVTGVDVGNAVITVVSDAYPGIEAKLNVAVAADPDPFDVLVSAKGLWRFSDPSNIGRATIGQNLTPVLGTHASREITPLDGGRVRVGRSSYFVCQHGIPPSKSSYVTEYTMLFDFALPSLAQWRVFYWAKPQLGVHNDGGLYINASNRLGHGSYSTTFACAVNTYYRLIIVYKGDGFSHLYINGAFIHRFNNYGDDTKSLAPTIWFFTDGSSGYDIVMDVSTIAIWDRVLTDAEIAALGVAESEVF